MARPALPAAGTGNIEKMEAPRQGSLTIEQPRAADDGDETVCCGVFEKDDEDVEFGCVVGISQRLTFG